MDELDLGDDGAGEDCATKFLTYAGSGMVIGGLFSTVESAFSYPLYGKLTGVSPMLFTLKLVANRAVLLGVIGGAFAGTACLSAHFRNKDDHRNAVYGGFAAGSIFGFKYRSWAAGLGWAVGLGIVLGIIKFRHGTYIPPVNKKRSYLDWN